MKNSKVISSKNLPARLPIITTIVIYLFLEKMQPAEWVWGAVGLLVLILWILVIIAKAHQDAVDIFEDKK